MHIVYAVLKAEGLYFDRYHLGILSERYGPNTLIFTCDMFFAIFKYIQST